MADVSRGASLHLDHKNLGCDEARFADIQAAALKVARSEERLSVPEICRPQTEHLPWPVRSATWRLSSSCTLSKMRLGGRKQVSLPAWRSTLGGLAATLIAKFYQAEITPAHRRTTATAAPPGPASRSTTAMPSKAGVCAFAALTNWNRSSIRRPA